MRNFILLLSMLFMSLFSYGQTTTVTGTVTDPDNINWTAAAVTFTLYNPSPGTPVTYNGVPLTENQLNVTLVTDGTGAFNGSINDNILLKPVGTQWAISVCPLASAPCQSISRLVITGTSQNLTSTINQQLQALRFPASYTARAYASVEISPIPPRGATYYDIAKGFPLYWTGTAWVGFGSNTGITPSEPDYSEQIANLGATAFASDPNFLINPITHTRSSNANDIVNAMSSIPRAIYDPMDTSHDGGLAAAIAGTSGFTPTQVIQATADYGECQVLQNKTIFKGMDIPLPAGLIINIAGLKLWSNTTIGGPYGGSGATSPILQHVDSTQVMLMYHAPGDTITCNGTTYNPQPGGSGGDVVHDIKISGMGAVATTTDIGVELNCEGCAAINVLGGGQIFGGPAVFATGTSDFMYHMGQPGAQLSGCKTYNSGALPISSFTAGFGACGAVMNASLDGGATDTYSSDGQAFASGAAAGPCYPNCAAYVAQDSGGYDNDIFVQVSSIGVKYTQNAIKSSNVRVDRTSREAIRVGNGTGGGIGSVQLTKVAVDTSCQDNSLQPNYSAGIATGCYAVMGQSSVVDNLTVSNSAGILGPSYVQCSIFDPGGGTSGASASFTLIGSQGNPNSTNPNNRAFCGLFDNSAVSGRVSFPAAQAPITATTANPDVNGITSIALNGQTVTTITGGVGSQPLWVYGPGTLAQGSHNFTNANNVLNLTGQNVTLASGQVVEYLNVSALATNIWQMVAGPPNQTPTHVNYAGYSAPAAPSLLSVYGDVQSLQLPGFSILSGSGAVQLFGPAAPSGQVCFVQEAVLADNRHVVSDTKCSTVDISALTSGEVFTIPQPNATMNLWLISNTEPNTVHTGKYPAPVSGGPTGSFWQYTTVMAGGDSSTPVISGDNTTGYYLGQGIVGPSVAPSGTCTPAQGGEFVVSQDGHGTLCPVGGGTWTTKF